MNMSCKIKLRDGNSIEVKEFVCIEHPNKTDGIVKIEIKDLDILKLNDGVTYTFFGSNIVKVRGEDIVYLDFN